MTKLSIIDHLKTVFFSVREYLLRIQLNKEPVGINARGDITKQFDLEAEKIAINYLLTHYPKARILSEEIGLVNESVNDFDYLFIIDPVDGSFNYSQGIPLVGFSIAVIEGDNIGTDFVTHALIGNIFSGATLTASKEEGAFLRDRPIKSNQNLFFENAIVTCSLNQLRPENLLLFQSVNEAFRQIRSFSCSSIELSYVIQGITSAHYDFRKRLTAENFLAASLILKEMGGNLTDLYGNPISNIENLVEGYSIVASHKAEEHHKYLSILRE